jgi:hypothetical protein
MGWAAECQVRLVHVVVKKRIICFGHICKISIVFENVLLQFILVTWGSPCKVTSFFSPWRWGESSTQVWMPTYVSILHIPQMIWVWRAMVEWYIDGKTEELGEKPVPMPLCSPQIPHGLTRVRTRASAVRGRRLATWAMARPSSNLSHRQNILDLKTDYVK